LSVAASSNGSGGRTSVGRKKKENATQKREPATGGKIAVPIAPQYREGKKKKAP
jgi:ribosome assembly protein YihI (activator of Der GTPase)